MVMSHVGSNPIPSSIASGGVGHWQAQSLGKRPRFDACGFDSRSLRQIPVDLLPALSYTVFTVQLWIIPSIFPVGMAVSR